MFALIAISFLLIYYLTTCIHAWSQLRGFPGPFLASFSFLWLFRVALSNKAFRIHMGVRKWYGKGLIRVAPDTLITDDPDVFRRINGAHNGYCKGDWYAVMRLDPYQHSMISTPDTAFHDDIKARVAAGYSGREVPSMEKDIDEQIGELKALIEREYLSTEKAVEPMDWGLVAQYFTLDSLTRVAFGEALGYLETNSDVHEYIQTMEDSGIYFALCSDVPWLGRVFLSKFVLGLLGPSVKDRKGLGVIMGVAKRIVGARFEGEGMNQQDMLGSFTRHGLLQRQCEAELLALLVAGSDTTANLLRVALFFIATTPRVYRKLQAEIDEGIASGMMSNPVTGAQGKNLRYLQAFLSECLRFNPPVSLLFPKVVPSEGDTLEGRFIPGGTKIATDFWSMGRRADIFGEDVSVFRPERFLEASPAKRTVMEKTTDLMFGYGRYMCPGKTMAWLEMNKLFVELLRDFEFQLVDPERPFTRSHRALFVIRNMQICVTKREIEGR
ncbi:cytochrome P450 [Cercophora newfieldiana]|uniref:Cytochrome P450 n=1 Tax=Cercophora newfieldiana TaxID=92897 RepID=A0AA39YSJ5_9PEZI|nr:cytochrome P450 [Cercophora newfieldiana]